MLIQLKVSELNHSFCFLVTLNRLHGNCGFIERNGLLRLWSVESDERVTSSELTQWLNKFFSVKDGKYVHIIMSYLSTPADIFSIISFRMSDTSVLSKMFVCTIVCTFGIVHYKLRIRRYRPCCAAEAVHTSWLRKLTEADLKNNNLESGGSNCENTKNHLDEKLMLLLCLTDSPAGLCEMWPSDPQLPAH